jgi:hypothetical protein
MSSVARRIVSCGRDPAVGLAHAGEVEREGRIGRPGAGVDRYLFFSGSIGSGSLEIDRKTIPERPLEVRTSAMGDRQLRAQARTRDPFFFSSFCSDRI